MCTIFRYLYFIQYNTNTDQSQMNILTENQTEKKIHEICQKY